MRPRHLPKNSSRYTSRDHIHLGIFLLLFLPLYDGIPLILGAPLILGVPLILDILLRLRRKQVCMSLKLEDQIRDIDAQQKYRRSAGDHQKTVLTWISRARDVVF